MQASVIIPVYNQLTQLMLTLHGFNAQVADTSVFEVIIADDGSDTAVSIDERLFGFPWRIVRQEHGGRAAARNFAIAAAQGKIIIMNDADRIPSSLFVAEHLKAHTTQPGAVVIGNPRELYFSEIEKKSHAIVQLIREGKIVKKSRGYLYAKRTSNLFAASGNTTSKIPWISFFSGNASVSKQTLALVGGFSNLFRTWGCEHFELGYRLYQRGFPFFLARRATNCHLAHARSLQFYRKHFQESIQLFSKTTGDSRVLRLYDFLIGRISLQQLEEIFGGGREAFANIPDIFFRLPR